MPTLTALNPIHSRLNPELLDPQAPAVLNSLSGVLKDDLSQLFAPVVIAPTYNNAKTLAALLDRLDAIGLPVIAVNDGSTDTTTAILQAWKSASADHVLVEQATNRGKASALQSGFQAAQRAGYTHAVTIDTDGQLAPEDIPALVAKAGANNEAFVLGVRDSEAADYPSRSRFGRWFSNLLIRVETGRQIQDSQCGLRIYPLQFTSGVYCRSTHYGYETEIITRAIWAGVPIVETPVMCRYFSADQRVSHFKPGMDSLRALLMHLRLLAAACNLLHSGAHPLGAYPQHSLPRQFLHWLNPITAWRQIRHDPGARIRFAAGFASGLFIANLPLYGVQTLVALYTARRFRLHPAAVLAGTNVAVPPIGPVLIAGGIAVGHLILHGSWPRLDTYRLPAHHMHRLVLPMLLDWAVGSVVLGVALAVITFVLLNFILKLLVDPPESAR